MHRVLLNFTVATIIGLVLPFKFVINILIVAGLLLLYVVVLVLKKRHFPLWWALGVLFGILLPFFARTSDDSIIFSQFINQKVNCTVTVDSIPAQTDTYIKFTGTVINVGGKPAKDKVILYVYDGKDIYENQRLEIENVKFKIPAGKRNFYGFNYKKHLKGENIFFTANVNAENIVSKTECEMTPYRYALKLNRTLTDRVEALFEKDSATIFKAILLGNKNDLDEGTLDDFNKSGLSHVMSVSGLHLAILAFLLRSFIKPLNKLLRFSVMCVAIIGFSAIVGFPTSVIRASVMLIMLTLADTLLIESDSLTNLSVAALILIIQNPNCIYDIGFVMSFTATLGIICLSGEIYKILPQKMPNFLKESFGVTLSAQIGTLFFSVYYFGKISVFAVIGNLLVGILLPAIYLFGILAVVTALGPFIWISEITIYLFRQWVSFCADLPGQLQQFPVNSFVLTGLFIFTVAAVMLPQFKNRKVFVYILLLSFVTAVTGMIIQIQPIKNSRITFINTEQSDCALFQTGDFAALIDTGTEYMGRAEVADYLIRNGVFDLEAIFISHFDTDHCGGVIPILERIKTKALYIPNTKTVDEKQYAVLEYANKNGISVFTLNKGDVIKYEDTQINSLFPEKGAEMSGNDSSLVISIENKDVSAVFPGDLEKDNLLTDCDCDILKVSHHGSKNGTTEEFLKKCTPEIAVIMLGADNMYGFPHAQTLERLKCYTDKIYRTDENGTIIIDCSDRKYKVKTLY